jgi:hypothetical protein
MTDAVDPAPLKGCPTSRGGTAKRKRSGTPKRAVGHRFSGAATPYGIMFQMFRLAVTLVLISVGIDLPTTTG